MASTLINFDCDPAFAPATVYLLKIDGAQVTPDAGGYSPTLVSGWAARWTITVDEACVGIYGVEVYDTDENLVGIGYTESLSDSAANFWVADSFLAARNAGIGVIQATAVSLLEDTYESATAIQAAIGELETGLTEESIDDIAEAVAAEIPTVVSVAAILDAMIEETAIPVADHFVVTGNAGPSSPNIADSGAHDGTQNSRSYWVWEISNERFRLSWSGAVWRIEHTHSWTGATWLADITPPTWTGPAAESPIGSYSATTNGATGSIAIAQLTESKNRFNLPAVELARDWSDAGLAEIRYRLGLSGETLEPESPETPPITIVPGDNPLTCACYLQCVNKLGLPEAGVAISARLSDGPGTAGYSYNTAIVKAVSDAEGLVVFEACIRLATYRFWRGVNSGGGITFMVPDAATAQVPELL